MAGVRDNTVSNVVSGGIASFKSVGLVPLKSLKVGFNPIQEGEGDPSPSNIRAISGWTGLNVYKSRKNLFTFGSYDETLNGVRFQADGSSIHITGTNDTGSTQPSNWTTQHITLPPGTYTITGSLRNTYSYGIYATCRLDRPRTGEAISIGGNSLTTTFTIDRTRDLYLTLGVYGPASQHHKENIDQTITYQIESGSTSTTYEPYNGTTVPVSWSDLGTVYGGYVDLISGEVWAEWGKRELGNILWNYFSTGIYYINSTNIIDRDASAVIYSDTLTPNSTISYANMTNSDIRYFMNNNTYKDYLIVKNGDYPNDYNGFRTWFAETYPDATICYKLAEPVLIGTIDPITIKSLIGTNNIWSNADTVEVLYCALESLDIYKQRFKTNEPHLLTSSGNVVSFNTDIVAPLKECKINFLPKQASGTPSPDNILPISGWNSITIEHSDNLWDGRYLHGKLDNNGEVYATVEYRNIGYIPVIPGSTIRIKFTSTISGSNLRFYYYNNAKEYITNRWVTSSNYTLTSETYYIRFYTDTAYSNSYRGGDIVIQYVSSVESNTITLPSTYYGGYVDIAKGTLVQDWGYVDLGDLTWRKSTITGDYQVFVSSNISSLINQTYYRGNSHSILWLCSEFSSTTAQSQTGMRQQQSQNNVITITQSGNVGDVCVRYDDCDTAEEFKAAVTGVQLAYSHLLNPVEYSLTPVQLKTLKNQNNIWSNTNGITEVKYWTHGSIADKRKVVWNQWLKPLTADNWQVYNSNNNTVSFSDNIATATWKTGATRYNSSIRNKTSIIQLQGQIWYISYMIKPSYNNLIWGVEFCGGRTVACLQNTPANIWSQCSATGAWYKNTSNYAYISCCYSNANDEFIGMTTQCKSPIHINLTQMFGAGNLPTKAEFEALCAKNGIDLTQYQPYDEGTLMYWYF